MSDPKNKHRSIPLKINIDKTSLQESQQKIKQNTNKNDNPNNEMIGVFNRAKRGNRFENTTTLCSEKNHGTKNQQLLSRYFQRFCPRHPILQQRTNISILIVTTTITMHRCDNTQKATANATGYRTG